MKKSILLCILFILSHWCEAQTYHSFLHDTAIWDETIIYPGSCDARTSAEGYFRKMIMNGDTTLKNILYKKIYEQDYYSFWVINNVLVFSSYNNERPGLVGAIREDSEKQVYFLAFDSTFGIGNYISACSEKRMPVDSEVLIYNFNLKVGDSLPWKKYNQTVIGIDSMITENGTSLPVFHFNSYNTDYWIEGLGSSLGFFGAFMPQPFECNCTLNCAQATEFQYPGENPCGGIYTSIQEPKSNSTFNVFPNPAHDKIIMNLSAQGNKPITISLLNEMDQVIWMKNEKVISGNFSEEIPVSDFPRGIYFVQIKTDNGTFARMISLQ